jgi:hypothetical protein
MREKVILQDLCCPLFIGRSLLLLIVSASLNLGFLETQLYLCQRDVRFGTVRYSAVQSGKRFYIFWRTVHIAFT